MDLLREYSDALSNRNYLSADGLFISESDGALYWELFDLANKEVDAKRVKLQKSNNKTEFIAKWVFEKEINPINPANEPEELSKETLDAGNLKTNKK